MKKKLAIAFFVIIFLILASNENKQAGKDETFPVKTASNIQPKENRILAIDITEGSGGYDSAFKKAKNIGISQVGLYFNWRDLEKAPGQYVDTYLDIAKKYYPSKNVKLDITVTPINTNQLVVPSDLNSINFDDQRIIDRYNSLIDHVVTKIGKENISSIVIASEADIYLDTSPSKWTEFDVFYTNTAKHIHDTYSDIKVAFEATYNGSVGKNKYKIASINRSSDVIGISYYPIDENFNVKRPAVSPDFERITSLYPNKKIWFYQFGYPSSETNGSSETEQAKFLTEAFRAWDEYRSQVQMIDFTWLYDYPVSKVKDSSKFYGIGNKKFSSFIGSLGFINYLGREKLAFPTLRSEAKARGW